MERKFDYTDEGEYLHRIHKLAEYNQGQIDGMIEHICRTIDKPAERKELLDMIKKLRAFADPQFIDMLCELEVLNDQKAQPVTLGTL